jgi:hypothetical protein
MRISDRKPLYPSIGTLYPEATEILSEAGDEAALGAALDHYPVFRKIWEVHQSQGVDDKSIDDAFYEREVQMCELTFDGQMNFSACSSCGVHDGCRRGCEPTDESQLCCLDVRPRLLLRLREAQRAGDPQRGVDLRVHSAEPTRRDQQLHPDLQRQRTLACSQLEEALGIRSGGHRDVRERTPAGFRFSSAPQLRARDSVMSGRLGFE